MYSSLITLNLPDWLNRSPRQEPPRPNVVAALRAEFQQALTSQKAELDTALTTQRAELQAEIAIERQAHEHTRAELAQSREHGRQQAIDMLDSTVKSQQRTLENSTAEMIALSGSNAALQEAMRRLEADHRLDQETISLLRERIHTMESELTTLRDERQQHIGTIADLRMAIDDLKRQLEAAERKITGDA